MSRTVSVSLEFSQPFVANLKINEELSDNELIELAKQDIIKQLKTKKDIPLRYGITDGKTLSSEEAKIGLIVKLKETGGLGIICEIKPSNKFPIKIATPGGLIGIKLMGIEKASKNTKIESVVTGREKWQKDMAEWYQGATGYFVNGGEIIPVVVGKNTKSHTYVIPVSHEAKGVFYKLDSVSLKRVFDTKAEAEKNC